jgi:hypothetical protein
MMRPCPGARWGKARPARWIPVRRKSYGLLIAPKALAGAKSAGALGRDRASRGSRLRARRLVEASLDEGAAAARPCLEGLVHD